MKCCVSNNKEKTLELIRKINGKNGGTTIQRHTLYKTHNQNSYLKYSNYDDDLRQI
jgi:hypothetical protein